MKRSRKTAAISEQSASPSISVRDLVEVLQTLPEFKEASPADMELAFEDIGYISPGRRDTIDLDPVSRRRLVKESRAYWRGDPLAHQAVRLWTDYAVGTGITFKANDSADQAMLTEFWEHPKNQCMTESSGQQQLSRQCLVDGDLFFTIFGAEDETKRVRVIDPQQIERIISDPEDEKNVLCYKRTDNSLPPKTYYYKDWAAEDSELVGLKDPDTNKPIRVEENVVVYHKPWNALGQRGQGLLFPVVFWSKEHRRFMEARVSITQALSKFAHKVTVKGGQKAVDAVQKKLQSSIAASPAGGRGVEKNPPPVPGSTWAQNLGIDLEAMPRATGAGDAENDGNQLKRMVCAGVNLPEHYFGNAANANLATATAMELPVLKSFNSYQEFWKDTWRTIFRIVLGDNSAKIDVDLPAMLQDDLRGLGQFLTGLHRVFPQISVPEILQLCLQAIGVNDIEAVMRSAEARKTELANAAVKVPTHEVPQPVPGAAPPTTPVAEADPEVAELARLADAIEESNRTPPPPAPPLQMHVAKLEQTVLPQPPMIKTATSKRLPDGSFTLRIEEHIHGA